MNLTAGAAPLRPGQFREAARVLARAFDDEPGVLWLFPDAGKRKRFLFWAFLRETRYARLYGEAYTTADGVGGVAMWLPPDQPFFTLARFVTNGYLGLLFKMGPVPLVKFLASMNRLDSLHRRDAPARHWYLATLGVDPPRQGRGVGGALIQPVLERADNEGIACYLETGKVINVRFYRKHGFEVVDEGDAPLGGPRYWTMLREPAGQARAASHSLSEYAAFADET